VNYADDFVILSRGCAEQALDWTRRVMMRIGLTLNEAKTGIIHAVIQREYNPSTSVAAGAGFCGRFVSRRGI
jgi:hypothetical protein